MYWTLFSPHTSPGFLLLRSPPSRPATEVSSTGPTVSSLLSRASTPRPTPPGPCPLPTTRARGCQGSRARGSTPRGCPWASTTRSAVPPFSPAPHCLMALHWTVSFDLAWDGFEFKFVAWFVLNQKKEKKEMDVMFLILSSNRFDFNAVILNCHDGEST